jgi:hypothetical protein
MRNKTYDKGCSKSKEQNKKAKKTIPMKIEEDSNLRLLVTKSFSAKMLANFWRKRGNDEKTYGVSSLFIGVRGVVSRNCLDMTVVSFPEEVCPLRRSEGDVFTRIREFSWNRIIRVNPLPRGASVGELGKNLTPSKRRVC